MQGWWWGGGMSEHLKNTSLSIHERLQKCKGKKICLVLLQVINKRTPTPQGREQRKTEDKTLKQCSKPSNVKLTRCAPSLLL